MIWEFVVIVAEVLDELREEKLEPSQWLKTKCVLGVADRFRTVPCEKIPLLPAVIFPPLPADTDTLY